MKKRRVTKKELDKVCLDCCDFIKAAIGCFYCGVERLKRLRSK
jgi:hypothetical protein